MTKHTQYTLPYPSIQSQQGGFFLLGDVSAVSVPDVYLREGTSFIFVSSYSPPLFIVCVGGSMHALYRVC